MHTNVFEAARTIPASDIARRAGLQLRKKGSREWSRCPFHGSGQEHTASLMFDQAGRYYCFGCATGGDSTAFYAAYYNIAPLEAAQRIAKEYGLTVDSTQQPPPPRKPTARDLQTAVEGWKEGKAARLCQAMHDAAATMAGIQQVATNAAFLDDPRFMEAQEINEAASTALCNLDAATPEQLMEAMAQEIKAKGGRAG